jgi:hypothetical protein
VRNEFKFKRESYLKAIYNYNLKKKPERYRNILHEKKRDYKNTCKKHKRVIEHRPYLLMLFFVSYNKMLIKKMNDIRRNPLEFWKTLKKSK